MSDLTEYDREIITAAERLREEYPNYCDSPFLLSVPDLTDLLRAVQAKRDAQRPSCGHIAIDGVCDQPATQEISQHNLYKIYRCDKHRIEVRELGGTGS